MNEMGAKYNLKIMIYDFLLEIVKSNHGSDTQMTDKIWRLNQPEAAGELFYYKNYFWFELVVVQVENTMFKFIFITIFRPILKDTNANV